MSSWRCTGCAIHWPFQGCYKECPICQETCWVSSSGPIPDDEARLLASDAHTNRQAARERRERIAAFEAECLERDIAESTPAFEAALGSLLC